MKRTAVLFQPLLVALGLGMLFILLQKPIFLTAMEVIAPEAKVQFYAGQYFDVLIYGDPLVLSANSILQQIKGVTTNIFEGVANASSIYAGRAKGNGDLPLLQQVEKITLQCTAGLVLLLSAICLIGSQPLTGVFTNNEEVLEAARQSSFWLVIYPLMAGFGLTHYGIFTGSSHTRPIMLSTLGALMCFMTVLKAAVPLLGNHGLWLSLMIYYLGTTIFLFLYKRQLESTIKRAEL